MPWFVSQKVPWERGWYITTPITITIVHNYVITSVLYVFYCHRHCLLLSSSLCFSFVFFLCICARIGGARSLKNTMAPKLLKLFLCAPYLFKKKKIHIFHENERSISVPRAGFSHTFYVLLYWSFTVQLPTKPQIPTKRNFSLNTTLLLILPQNKISSFLQPL